MTALDPHVHLLLHARRAAELQAATHRPSTRGSLKAQLGWTLVELGLRLATPRVPVVGPVSS